mgnify:CR=1 FL=1
MLTGRILLVDIDSFHHDPESADNLSEAADNFFSVACNLGGPSRLSVFSIMTFSFFCTEVTPLPLSEKHVKHRHIQRSVVQMVLHVYFLINSFKRACINYHKMINAFNYTSFTIYNYNDCVNIGFINRYMSYCKFWIWFEWTIFTPSHTHRVNFISWNI